MSNAQSGHRRTQKYQEIVSSHVPSLKVSAGLWECSAPSPYGKTKSILSGWFWNDFKALAGADVYSLSPAAQDYEQRGLQHHVV